MYLSLNWLKRYLDFSKDFDPKKLGDELTLQVAEVEDIKTLGENLENIVVGKILSLEQHPNADKLRLATVDLGNENIKVVCGGVNLKENMLIAFAKVGAKVRWHGEGELIELKEAEIRGIKSKGMICASSEIGLGDLFPGGTYDVMDLTEYNLDSKLGWPLAQALGLDDVVYEIENKTITHRPDLWGHYGFAREISVLEKIKLKDFGAKKPIIKEEKKLKVQIKDKKLCSRYMAVSISGIKIQESPAWLKSAVTAIGMRPIGNIVDITNYVMFDIGQPLHAFDADKLKSGEIIVRTAKKGERIYSIDGQERILESSDLIIADTEKPIAIAGVMGGLNTEIDNKTVNVIIESANFDADALRKTSQRLNLRSEAVMRFEKNLDPNFCELGLLRCVNLIQELIPEAKVVTKIVDEGKFKLNQKPIEITFEKIYRHIGLEIPAKEIIDILEKLGFTIKTKKKSISVITPTWRATKDISIQEDIIEEIARMYGYQKITSILPKVQIDLTHINQERKFVREAKNILVDIGFCESVNYSYNGEEQLNKIGVSHDNYIRTVNPLSQELNLMRQSLIPNLIVNAYENLKYFQNVKMFELGRVFLAENGKDASDPEGKNFLPLQPKYLAGFIVQSGDDQPYFQTKKVAETLLSRLGFDFELRQSEKILPWAHLVRSADILIDNKKIGALAELNPQVQQNFDIKQKVAIFELDFTLMFELFPKISQYQPLPKFPSVRLDVSVVLDEKVLSRDVEKSIRKAGGVLIKAVELFDVYQGQNIGENKKSMAYHIEFRSDDKTLEMAEAEKLRDRICEALEKELGGKVRK